MWNPFWPPVCPSYNFLTEFCPGIRCDDWFSTPIPFALLKSVPVFPALVHRNQELGMPSALVGLQTICVTPDVHPIISSIVGLGLQSTMDADSLYKVSLEFVCVWYSTTQWQRYPEPTAPTPIHQRCTTSAPLQLMLVMAVGSTHKRPLLRIVLSRVVEESRYRRRRR